MATKPRALQRAFVGLAVLLFCAALLTFDVGGWRERILGGGRKPIGSRAAALHRAVSKGCVPTAPKYLNLGHVSVQTTEKPRT